MRTYVRYAVPLTLLSVIALLPIAYTGYAVQIPADADGPARRQRGDGARGGGARRARDGGDARGRPGARARRASGAGRAALEEAHARRADRVRRRRAYGLHRDRRRFADRGGRTGGDPRE